MEQGGQGGQGGGSPEKQKAGEGSILGRKARKCRFILRLIKQHSLSLNRIPIEFGYTIGHE